MSSTPSLNLELESSTTRDATLRQLAGAIPDARTLSLTAADVAKRWTPDEVREELERQAQVTVQKLRTDVKRAERVLKCLTTHANDNAYWDECGKAFGFPQTKLADGRVMSEGAQMWRYREEVKKKLAPCPVEQVQQEHDQKRALLEQITRLQTWYGVQLRATE